MKPASPSVTGDWGKSMLEVESIFRVTLHRAKSILLLLTRASRLTSNKRKLHPTLEEQCRHIGDGRSGGFRVALACCGPNPDHVPTSLSIRSRIKWGPPKRGLHFAIELSDEPIARRNFRPLRRPTHSN